MPYQYTPAGEALLTEVKRFMDDHIYPNEAEYLEQVEQGGHDDLLPTATALAHKIAERPPLAVAKIKEGMRRALDPDWTDLGAWVSTSLAALFQTEDHREGVKSFLEKRQPQFVGR